MFKPLKRPYYYRAQHAQDVYPNLGFDYRDSLFSKTMSKQVFANKKNADMLMEIQKMVYLLIEEVKTLKTRFVFAVDKDSKLIN